MSHISPTPVHTRSRRSPYRHIGFGVVLLAIVLLLTLPGTARADGIIVVAGDATINKCETESYTITVENASSDDWTDLVVSADISLLTGWSYVPDSTSMNIDGGSEFCSVDPVEASGVLVWDIDSDCSTLLTLAPGEVLFINFEMTAGCDAVSASLNPSVTFNRSSGGPGSDSSALSIQVLPGGVTIKQTPNVIPQVVGGQVTWSLTIENSGLGIISNVVISDVLGSGLSFDSATPAGDNQGQTTTWGPAQITALASMNPGDIVTIGLTATVTACNNLDSVADVRWGCSLDSACFDTSQQGGTATASVQRIPRTPLISYTPSSISFGYCQDYVDISFPVQNTGDGMAHDIQLYVDFGSLVVSNVASGAIYDAVNKRFELSGTLAGGDSFDLSFRLSHGAWCGPFPAGSLIWQTVYKDECENLFYPPVQLSNISAPAERPSLSVSKDGAPSIIQIGDSVTYHIQASYQGTLSCGSSSASTILVTDTVPAGFVVLDPGTGTFTPGAGGTGGTIVWMVDPASGLDSMVSMQAPGRDQCETYCDTTFTNALYATATDCCGCLLSASTSQTSAIECDEGVTATRSVSPSSVARCSKVTYSNQFDFDSSSTVLLNALVFEEEATMGQMYDNGSLTVMLGAADVTGSVAVTELPGGGLVLDFSGAGGTSLADQVLAIQYDMTIPESALNDACGSSHFYDWASLSMGPSGSECLGDGIIWQATELTIEPPAMSLSIQGLSQVLNQCETETVTLNLSQTSSVANPRDVRLVLSGLNYYVVNPSATVCGGVAPISCTPTIDGNGDYVWEFGDAFTGSGQSATLQLTLRKRCGSVGELQAIAHYDDLCNDDSAYDDTCSITASAAPALLLSADLLIEQTPEVFYATTQQVEFKIYVTNRGSGTAYNVWVDDVLGAGLDYGGCTVDNMTGVTVNADLDHEGGAINGASITISEMAPGERREITLQADLVACNNLTNDVAASWGCIGVDCQTSVTDQSIVRIPAPLLVTTNYVTSPVDACADPDASITLRNAGQTTCYALQATVTLPTGLLYQSGSTSWRINGGSWNGPNVIYDPNPIVSPLVWTQTEIPALASAGPGDTIEIKYDLTADCPFAGNIVTVATQYTNPCGQVFLNADSHFLVSLREPAISITKTRSPSIVDCDDMVTWTITVRNTSGYTLPIIWVEDTLPVAYTYASSVGDPPFTSDNGTVDGQLVTWELRNVNHGDTVTLTLVGTPSGTFCDESRANTVSAWWGCGIADGSSATKPGVDAPDDDLCLATASVSDNDTPIIRPEAGFASVSLNPTSIDACNDSTELTVVIENTGPTDASDLDLTITLPAGLTYNNGTAQACLDDDDTCTPSTISDPAIAGQIITFYDIGDKGNDLANLLQASGGNDTIVLKFDVQSSCYTTGQAQLRLYYYDCCDDTQYQDNESVTITALYPDLDIDITPLNSQVGCGISQTWDIEVTNNGAGAAQVVVVEVAPGAWIDLDPGASTAGLTAMGGGVYGWESNDLAGSGGTRTFTLVGTLNPDGYPSQNDCTLGLRQLGAQVTWACGATGDAVDGDPTTNSNYECTASPWVSAANATLRMPDLRITGIQPTMTCTGDGAFSGTVVVSVRNYGNGIAYGPFTISVSDGKGWSATGTYNGDVAAGATVQVTIDSVSWQPTCQPCAAPYTFNATVDTGNDVCECGEANNTYGPTDYVTPIPDLIISDILFDAVDCSDDAFSGWVQVRVSNQGCATANNVPVALTTDGCLTFSNQTITSLAPGATQTAWFPLSDDWTDCSDQTCGFTATVDPSGTICECDGANNNRTESYSHALPDLLVSDIAFDLSCGDDHVSGTINVTVTNQGYADANNFAVLLSTDGCLPSNTGGVGSALSHGESTIVSFAIDSPWGDCSDSLCQVTATADWSNVICECNGDNNARSESTDVSLPNLRVLSVTPSTVCLSDDSFRTTIAVSVDNNGTVDANNVTVALQAACAPSGTFASQTVDLTAGGSDTLTYSWDHGSVPCSCLYTAQIDPLNAVCECSGDDNTASADHTADMPDISVVGVTAPLACVEDGVYSVTPQITVANSGCGANLTQDIAVRLTVYEGTACAGQVLDQWTMTLTSVNIASAGSQVFNLPSHSISGNLADAAYGCATSIMVELDYTDAICEIDGANNAFCASLPSPNIPDLAVSGETVEIVCNGVDGGLVASGAITVTNAGCGTFGPSVINARVTLYDGEGCLGPVLAQWDVPLMAASGIVTGGQLAVSFPPTPISATICQTACGPLSLHIELDPDDAICETDGDNNTYCTAKRIDIPDLVVQGVTPLRDDAPGAVGTINVCVANVGCGDVNSATLQLVSDCGLSFLGKNVSLASGEERDVIFGYPPPPRSPCQCIFTATFDPLQGVCECTGDNNIGMSEQTDLTPELSVIKRASKNIAVIGESITYTIVVSNIGETNATGVVISDTLSPKLEFVGPVVLLGSSTGSTAQDAGDLPTLASDVTIVASTSVTLTYQAKIIEIGTISNTVTVTSTQTPDPEEDEEVVDASEMPALITGCPLTFCPSWTLGYSLSIENPLPYPLTNLIVQDTLPEDTCCPEQVPWSEMDWTADAGERHLTWHVPQLESGATIKLGFSAHSLSTLTTGDLVVNTFTYTADQLSIVSSESITLTVDSGLCGEPEPSPDLKPYDPDADANTDTGPVQAHRAADHPVKLGCLTPRPLRNRS